MAIGVFISAILATTAAAAAAATPPDDTRTKAGARNDRPAQPLQWIRVSEDRTHFVGADSGRRFVVWGVNYDHDERGRLIEQYWHSEWEKVEADLAEIKALGANTVRVHLQLAEFMDSAERPNGANLARLGELVRLAERTGLYLDLTGLGCYHRQDVPPWYDLLEEPARWQVQARFWRAVAAACRHSPAVFCYDLMNEPVVPGRKQTREDAPRSAPPRTGETRKAEARRRPANDDGSRWLAGQFGGKHFVQRIARDLGGRTRVEVARAWVRKLTGTIREVDQRHLITVGVIPWTQSFKDAEPLFYHPRVRGPLDFVSVHFYPRKGRRRASLEALAVYEVGKPLVIEEIFPLRAGVEETGALIEASRPHVDGWISFYWGSTIEQNAAAGDLHGAIVAEWLRWWRAHAPRP